MYKTMTFLCFLICLQGVLHSQVMLQYRLKKGDVFTFEQQAEQQITQTIEGATQKLTNRVSGILTYKVLEKMEKGYLLEFVFRDLNFQIESSEQGLILDIQASKPQSTDDLQARIFNALLDVPIEMEINQSGEILNVKGGDRLVAHVVRQSGLPDGFTRTVMEKSLEKEYGSEALAKSYEQMTYIYPEQAVESGATWTNTFHGKLQVDNRWHLDNLTSEFAAISGTASIIMNVDEPSMTMRLSGTQDTKITADRTNGFIREMKVNSQAEGISTSVQTGELEIPTIVTSNVIYRLIVQKHVQ